MMNTGNAPALFFILFLFLSCQRNPYKQGHELYKIHCENCHMEDGSGLSKLIPSLAKSPIIQSDPDRLACLMRQGIRRNPLTNQEMPANHSINEVEITNIINYLRHVHTSHKVAIKVNEVEDWLNHCQ